MNDKNVGACFGKNDRHLELKAKKQQHSVFILEMFTRVYLLFMSSNNLHSYKHTHIHTFTQRQTCNFHSKTLKYLKAHTRTYHTYKHTSASSLNCRLKPIFAQLLCESECVKTTYIYTCVSSFLRLALLSQFFFHLCD